MNKGKALLALVLVALSASLAVGIYYLRPLKASFTSQKDGLKNPSRGFYVQVDSSRADKIQSLFEDGYRLVFVAYNIQAYSSESIPEQKLEELETILHTVRDCHMKAIVRPAYGFENDGSNDAASFEQIEEHVGQIASVVNRNTDVILSMQAGLLGPWGEWHSSSYLLGSEEEQAANRNRLLKALLDSYDDSVIINVRRPRFIREAEAFGLDVGRLGFHNDGLLSSESDLGTYDDRNYTREQELDYIKDIVETGLNGGETAKLSEYCDARNAAAEFSKLKLTYLNAKYNKDVLESWQSQTLDGENAYTHIEKRLGYRFFADWITYPRKILAPPFKSLQQIRLNVSNEGFSAIEKGYKSEWVIEYRDGSKQLLPINGEPSAIQGGASQTLALELSGTKNVVPARIGLQIYDSQQEMCPENSVELANADFSFENGINYFLIIDEQGYAVSAKTKRSTR